MNCTVEIVVREDDYSIAKTAPDAITTIAAC
jgi:hypothetical protein